MAVVKNQIVSKAKITPACSDKDFITVQGISKSYGIVKALEDVTFGVKKGEVHALLGENGAGKSTLVKIIMGEETPNKGDIIISGKKVEQYSSAYAQSLGISMVHQELAIFENMTVAENIFPGCNFRTKIGSINWRQLNQRAQESIQIFEMNLQATQKMDSLTLAQQQMVEILRCISNGQHIILLDEPTSGLNNEEVDKLMDVIRKLADRGITIIYISHRINEIMAMSDRITVMRDGKYVCTFINDEDLNEEDMVSKMVGRELFGSLYSKKPYINAEANPVLLKVNNLTKRNVVDDVSFSLHQGEVVGFFGLEGSGTNTLSRMLYGLEGKEKGEIVFKGETLQKLNSSTLVEKKILYLNNNRKKAGLLLDSPSCENMILPVIDRMSRRTILLKRKMQDYTEKYIKTFSITISSIFQKPRNLSGGNQQKLIVNEPTRGIDVGAKAEINRFLLDIVNKGIGLIVFSSELPELMSLCDRIIIMKQKRIVGELKGDEITEEAVIGLAAGGQ
jgi:ABC-type sugar transport system ATPase subunit